MILQKITSQYQAKEELYKLGISFDRVVVDKFDKGELGIHDYFMRGDCDVAYFTRHMQTLFIHEVPRKWCQTYLDKTVEA